MAEAPTDDAKRPFPPEVPHIDWHERVVEQARQDREGDDLSERNIQGKHQHDRSQEQNGTEQVLIH